MKFQKIFFIVGVLLIAVYGFSQIEEAADPINSDLEVNVTVPVEESVESVVDDEIDAVSESELITPEQVPLFDVSQITTEMSEPPSESEIPTILPVESGPRISQIQISGNININTEAITGVLSSRVGNPFDLNAIQNDIDSILNLGFFTSATYQKDDTPNGIVLTFTVIEYPKITEIEIEGYEPLAKEEIMSILKIQVGNVFNEHQLEADSREITRYYESKGYLATITEMADLDDTGVFYLPIAVFKLNSISFEGNVKTKTYVLSRDMTLRSGDYFSFETLQDDITAIYNRGYLEEIKQPQISTTNDNTIDVLITVVEKKTGQINLGLGYSARQKLVGQVKVSDSNFQGAGRDISFLWEQGTRNGYQGGGSWEFSFTEPWLLDGKTSGTFSLYNKLIYRFSSGTWNSSALPNDVNYDERHKGGRISFNKAISRKSSLIFGVRYDDVTTNPSLLQEDEIWKIMQSGQVYNLNFGWSNDFRNYIANPTAGFYQLAQIDLGHTNGSKYTPTLFPGIYKKTPLKGNFAKGTLEYRLFITPGKLKGDPTKDKRGTFAFRARAGAITGTVPFFEQMFVGGAETLRGYDDDRFWGNYMALANLEYRQPILDYFSLVAFADYGDAWGAEEVLSYNDLVQSEGFKGHLGVGLGARFNTPMGQIRLDWAFGDEGNKVHFSMGHTF